MVSPWRCTQALGAKRRKPQRQGQLYIMIGHGMLERVKAYAVQRRKTTEIAMCRMETQIQNLISRCCLEYGICINDAWVCDSDSFLIHLDTEFSGPAYEDKSSAINELESEIQRLVGEFAEIYQVEILDVDFDCKKNSIRFKTGL